MTAGSARVLSGKAADRGVRHLRQNRKLSSGKSSGAKKPPQPPQDGMLDLPDKREKRPEPTPGLSAPPQRPGRPFDGEYGER